jgi:hypothetical protein
VVSATLIEVRHLREGVLGCPVCRAEYPIHGGVADFRPSSLVEAASRAEDRHAPLQEGDPADPFIGMRLAALLNLADPSGFALLLGEWGRVADSMEALPDLPPLVLLDPPGEVEMRPGRSGLRSGVSIPIAGGAARAVAVDAGSTHLMAEAVRVTRAGGRIVGPITARLPDGVRELARDEAVWVAQRESAQSGLVQLHVRRAAT